MLSVLPGCAQTDGGEAAQETIAPVTAGAADEVSAEPEKTELKPDLPERDLAGYEFTVYSRDAAHHTKEVFSEELNGEVVNDAAFQRNLTVESAYNVKLSALLVTENPEDTMSKEFIRIVAAGDSAFDVALMHTVHAGSTALKGTACSWRDVPYVDFEKPWWNSALAEELDIDGYLFLAVSDYCISAIDYESNKTVVPAVYEIVLQSKYARDEASQRMLDLILEGRVYTFGYIYDDWKGMQWTLQVLMSKKSKDSPRTTNPTRKWRKNSCSWF